MLPDLTTRCQYFSMISKPGREHVKAVWHKDVRVLFLCFCFVVPLIECWYLQTSSSPFSYPPFDIDVNIYVLFLN